MFIKIHENAMFVSIEYHFSQIWGLIWDHNDDKLGIKVCVSDYTSNGCERCFHVCSKILQCDIMLDKPKHVLKIRFLIYEAK